MWMSWLQKRLRNRNDEVVFFENDCLYNNGSSCKACIDLCQFGAFQIENEKVMFDSSNCIKCKLCCHCCPREAIYIKSELIYQYELIINECDEIRFTCPVNQNSENDVVVPCLSILSPEMILIAFNQNKHVEIYFDPTLCKYCKLSWSMKNSISYLQEFNYIARGRVNIIHEKVRDIQQKKSNFRDLWFKQDQNSCSTTQVEQQDNQKKRSYLIEYLKKEGKDQYLSLKMAKALRLTQLNVNEKCILCGYCVETCPVGALDIIYENKSKILVFQPINCIGCGICQNSCSNITLIPETKLSKELLQPKILKNE